MKSPTKRPNHHIIIYHWTKLNGCHIIAFIDPGHSNMLCCWLNYFTLISTLIIIHIVRTYQISGIYSNCTNDILISFFVYIEGIHWYKNCILFHRVQELIKILEVWLFTLESCFFFKTFEIIHSLFCLILRWIF